MTNIYYNTYEDIKQLERKINTLKSKELNYDLYYIIQTNHEKYSLNKKSNGFMFDYLDLSNKSLNEINDLIDIYEKKRKFRLD
jgi:hypothetical protein